MGRGITKWNYLLLAPVLLSVLLAACGTELIKTRFSGGPDDLDPKLRNTVINIATTSDTNSVTLNAILVYIIEEGYGYSTQVVTLSDAEIHEALKSGRVDVALAVKQPGNGWFDGAVAAGEVIDSGPAYDLDGHTYNSALSSGLEVKAAELVPMLKNFNILHRRLKATDDWFKANPELGTKRAAVYFLWNYNFEDGWKFWMPYDPAERVRRAMEVFTGLTSSDPYRGYEIDRNAPGGGTGNN
ncbi:MAG: hypothetical protein FJ317_06940 [SAR202 cluster bacterium]|nr:hypothetical protein [SAR202 cluster bacterium]